MVCGRNIYVRRFKSTLKVKDANVRRGRAWMQFSRAAVDLSQEQLRSPAAAGVSNMSPVCGFSPACRCCWLWPPRLRVSEVGPEQTLNKNVCVGPKAAASPHTCRLLQVSLKHICSALLMTAHICRSFHLS